MMALSGFIIGAMFGFVLHRGGLTRYSTIMGALLLRDFKAMNFMFTGIAVASLLYGLSDLAGLGVAPRINGYFGIGHIIGGILFGIGMATAGLCPGTCMARFGSGKALAGVAVVGLFAGVFLYDLLFEQVSALGGEPTFITLAMVWDVSYAPLAMIFGLLFLGLSFFLRAVNPARGYYQRQERKSLLQGEWGAIPAGAMAGVLIFTATALGEYLSFAGGFLALGAHLASFVGYTFESVPVLNESTLWRALLALGLIPGALLSSYLTRTIQDEKVTPLFQAAFGPRRALRAVELFFSGTLMAFGALVGGGCTTGAFMSGWPTLSMGNFLMGITFFASAMVTANLLFLGRYQLFAKVREEMKLVLAND